MKDYRISYQGVHMQNVMFPRGLAERYGTRIRRTWLGWRKLVIIANLKKNPRKIYLHHRQSSLSWKPVLRVQYLEVHSPPHEGR